MKNLESYGIKVEHMESTLKERAEKGNEIALETSRDHASQNLPKKESKPRALIGKITSYFNESIVMLVTFFQSALAQCGLDIALEEREATRAKVTMALEGVESLLRLKKREREKIEKAGNIVLKKLRRWHLTKPFIYLAALLDILMSSSAFMQMGYTLITAILVGLGLGASILILGENFRNILDRCKTLAQKRIVAIAIFLGLAIIFYSLGYFRSIGLDNHSGIAVSPWYFVCLNLFFTSIVVVVTYFAKPTKAEYKLIDEFRRLNKDIADAEKKKQALEAELEEARKVYNRKREEHEKILIYTSDLQKLVVRQYESAVQVYISENIQKRSDGVIPDFFEQEPPALTLHSFKK